ncbi:MAG: alpha/beta fold hydrolase [Nocardioides sp.]
MLSSLSGPRRRFVLAVAALTVVGLGAAILAAVPRGRAQADPVAQDQLGPVLLVPGYGGSIDGLTVLASALVDAGRDATVVRLTGDGTGDLAEQAHVLDEAVSAALARTGEDTVDVVGYSAGGVIARLWLKQFDRAASVRRVVTLGSPHHGTNLSTVVSGLAPDSCPTACQQLATDSELLRRLNAGDETPSGPTWVSLWSTDDRTVVPPESASLAGALNVPVQSICPQAVLEHGEIPRAPAVIAMTVALLAEPEVSLPNEDLCPSTDRR